MKSKFSTSWISSVQPRKQRKYRFEAPFHIRHSFLSANLSKELRAKHKMRSIPLRVGDEVIIKRGTFAKQKGKILDVNVKKLKVTIEGVTRKKSDGTKINVYFDPSKLQIIALKLDDSRRLKSSDKNESKKSEEKTNAPNTK
ncbi:50S ribosomal protein L24 [Candidatus Pacearchaeota archaeon]|nr:50S ribosomal protein L24 [Candidatus Pacearchaeota archaeon]